MIFGGGVKVFLTRVERMPPNVAKVVVFKSRIYIPKVLLLKINKNQFFALSLKVNAITFDLHQTDHINRISLII